jgi:hypothetical protein
MRLELALPLLQGAAVISEEITKYLCAWSFLSPLAGRARERDGAEHRGMGIEALTGC